MKHMLLSGIALFAPIAVTAASFEGKVNFKMTSGKNQPQDINYSIKGDKLRVDLPSQQGMGGMIMDLTKRESTIIMDQQQMYMTMAMPDAAADQNAKKKKDDTKLEKTDETEKILGYTATKYIATSGKETTELWLAEGLGTFMSFNQGNPMMGGRGRGSAPAQQGWERALAGKDMFPLRVVGKDFKLEATAIDKTSLADSLFAPPPSYQKLDMGGMMGGMMKGMIPGAR
jgi:hypothetical protein